MDGRVVEHCHTTVGSLATDALVREILKLIGKVTKDFANIIMNENFCINNSDVTITRKIYKKINFTNVLGILSLSKFVIAMVKVNL